MKTLQFTPYAFAKLRYLRDLEDSEISGFGVTETKDPLLVTDFKLIEQECSPAHTELDDTAVNNYMMDMFDKGFEPNQCMRIWIHTHPKMDPKPSQQDEKTCREVLCDSDWAVMYIINSDDEEYARLIFNVGPKGRMELDTEINWNIEFPASDFKAWKEEFDEKVTPWGYYGYAGYYQPNYQGALPAHVTRPIAGQNTPKGKPQHPPGPDTYIHPFAKRGGNTVTPTKVVDNRSATSLPQAPTTPTTSPQYTFTDEDLMLFVEDVMNCNTSEDIKRMADMFNLSSDEVKRLAALIEKETAPATNSKEDTR